MGTLTYDGAAVEFDDRLLTHLQVVMVQKFRRGEPFLFSWLIDRDAGGGRHAIWLTPALPVHFRFGGSRVPAIDPAWLDLLSESADSSRGLIALDEHGAPVRTAATRRF